MTNLPVTNLPIYHLPVYQFTTYQFPTLKQRYLGRLLFGDGVEAQHSLEGVTIQRLLRHQAAQQAELAQLARELLRLACVCTLEQPHAREVGDDLAQLRGVELR